MQPCRLPMSPMGRNDGIALFVVMWALAILMVLVLSFSFLARTETHASMVFRDNAERKLLADAGIERGIFEIIYRRQNLNNEIILPGMEVWGADGTTYTDHVGEGRYSVSIMGESGKLDINKVPDILLKNLLLNIGIKDDEADKIVDSIMDFKDPSGLTRLNGAGDDYYMSLPNPYKTKKADFDTIEELLLVKGVTPAILYGDGNQKGIIDFLTVNSKSTLVNLNYASKEVIMALPGMTADLADQIIKTRQDQPIKKLDAVQQIVAGGYSLIVPYITVDETNVFTVESQGLKGDEKAGYPVKATVIIDIQNKCKYVYYKSPAYRVH